MKKPVESAAFASGDLGVRCPECGAENLAGASFCIRCGTGIGSRRDSGVEPFAAPASPRRPRLRLGTMDLEEVGCGGRAQPSRRLGGSASPRRSRLGVAALFASALALTALSTYALVRPDRAPRPVDPTIEREPNDDFSTPNVLRPRTKLSGYIGQRRSPSRGDVDLFRLPGSDEGELPVRVDLGALPNVDLVLEIFDEGKANPRFVIDGGGVGEGEIAPNLPVPRRPYLVRVREREVPGRYPMENISDRYTLRWQRGRAGEELEREPNDAPETAQPVAVGGSVDSYIGTNGDIDVYCLRGPGGPIVARVSGLAGIDLILRVVDRLESRSRRVDDRGIGKGEETSPIVDAREGRTCFEVTAKPSRDRSGGGRASEAELEEARGALRPARGDMRYTFDVLAAPEATSAAAAR